MPDVISFDLFFAAGVSLLIPVLVLGPLSGEAGVSNSLVVLGPLSGEAGDNNSVLGASVTVADGWRFSSSC